MDATALLIKNALFPAWAAKNRSARLRYLAELQRSQFLSVQALRDLQWRSLRNMLAHAQRESPFYRKTFHQAGIAPGDVRTPRELRAVPTLSKAQVQESGPEMIAASFKDRPLVRDMTGGSTGSPMVFYYDENRRDSRTAAAMRHDRWTGWDIGQKMGVLWGAPRDLAQSPAMKDRVRDWILQRSILLDASAIDDTRLLAFHERLLRQRPPFLLAYANTLALFAGFLRDAGLRPAQPRAIICSGEVLTAESRALIEATFGAPVFNRYGSREFSVIGSECDRHEGLHVNAENLFVEVFCDGEPALDREGEIVVTDLRNFAMPLIRYRTRDVGVMSSRACSCGRGLPLMHLTGGRVTDFLTANGGRRVSGIALATYGITNIPGIRQIQFVQDRLGSVTARIVKGPEWSEGTLPALFARLRGFLGESMEVKAEFTHAIPLEASGKYRFTISTLETGAAPYQK
jgi:phenylacetate-CoA ligase